MRALLSAVTRHPQARLPGCVLGALLSAPLAAAISPNPLSGAAVGAPAPATSPADQLEEIIVQTREPRYVAPTRRDRIGRIWAPVLIDGKGPYRLVLDTGATRWPSPRARR